MIKECPLVTVYMPTHNRRALLERALLSVLDQTYKNVEIIVVDDGSQDDTESFMKNFQLEHSTVKYLRHQTPKGANAARNFAIRESKGYFITGMDDDDEMLPKRIEKLIEVYDDRYAYVFSKWNTVDDKGNTIPCNYSFETISLDDMLYKNITGNQVFTTKEMFVKAGMFDEAMPATQDYDMWIRLLTVKPTAKFLNESTYNLYDTSHDRISNSRKRKKGYLKWYNKHKSLMTLKQKRHNLLRFRSLEGKQIGSLIIVKALYDIGKWPRLYLGYFKRLIMNKYKI